MNDECQAPGLECEQGRLKCQLPLIESEKAQRERREEMSRLTEQEAKQALITAQCAVYPRLDVAKYLKPMYTYVEQTEAELNRLQVALEATIAEKEALRKVAEESKQLAFANVFCNSSMTEICVGCVFKGLCDALAAVKGESNQTTWHENGEFWECEKCGYAFTLTGGSPVEHEISYCPKCGRGIAEFVVKEAD